MITNVARSNYVLQNLLSGDNIYGKITSPTATVTAYNAPTIRHVPCHMSLLPATAQLIGVVSSTLGTSVKSTSGEPDHAALNVKQLQPQSS